MTDGGRQRIWITRAQPGAAVTEERVRALGHEAVTVPLITLHRLPGVRVDLQGVAALAFTSANGVRAFAEACADRELQVFAVGAATAQAAKAAGFRKVLSSDGDVSVLAEGLAARRRELKGAILHPGAAEPAGDLEGALAQHGIEVRSLALYESVPTPPDDATAERLVGMDAVLLHSAAAAKVLARVLRAHPAPKMRALGISQAAIRPLARTRMAAKQYAPFPLEAALLNLIGRKP